MHLQRPWTALAIFLILLGCQSESAQDIITTDEFLLPANYSIEVIAGEPLLEAPVAVSFDSKGRIWVVELPGYMRDIDGSEEDKADGRIVVLTDENQDGVMDKRQLVIDDLQSPRTLLHAYGGLLYSDASSLWWVALNDTELGAKVLVDSMYLVGGNIEHQPNNLTYHLDNWIYSANSTARYRLKNGQWEREATSFRGQWGLTVDVEGRFYYNNNWLPLATDYAMPNQLVQNPFQKVQHGHSQAIATSNALFPYQATSVNRGYIEGVLDEEDKVREFTSACGPVVYTGPALGEDFFQNAFVCAPEANLIKRYILQTQDGEKTAIPAYDSTEFLISTDETFRPINLFNAPDGSLYILDLRKGVIQHRAYMTSYLREQIEEKGLDTLNGRGRIYRIAATDQQLNPALDRTAFSQEDWINLLASPVHYERQLAQQQLVFQKANSLMGSIERVALDTSNPYGQLHAWWTLEGLGLLDQNRWEEAISSSSSPIVLETLVRLSAQLIGNETTQLPYFRNLIALDQPLINQQLAIRLGQMNFPEADELLLELIARYGNEPVFCEALISGISTREAYFLSAIQSVVNSDTLNAFLTTVLANKASNTILSPQLPKPNAHKDNRTAGFNLYNIHCVSCHGLDGKGIDQLGPPLLDSEYVSGSKDRLILLILNGLKGPITVNGQRYTMNTEMPGFRDNPDFTDEDIADLLAFLRNSFSFSDTGVPVQEIARWREATEGRVELFTEEELKTY